MLVTTLVAPARGQGATSDERAAIRVNQLIAQWWTKQRLKTAAEATAAEFLRRATLDLAGRIPTPRELDRYLTDKASNKREKLVRRLIASPEFPLHFGNVLDEMIQGRYAGNDAFVDYLRRSLRDGKSWEQLFREMMIGPWSNKGRAANRFLDKRAKTLDRLTSDATRVFFGVDISCAKCHDHPLVDDWKQEHFYGMASFFNRTTGGKGRVGEKDKGEVTYLAADGKEKTARLMFLSGRVIPETKPAAAGKPKAQPRSTSRRRMLVAAALDDRTFFRRALVNRLWQYFFGRGLVEPVDQMHSANEPAIPGVLKLLADDFAANDYDVRRLITIMTLTRIYGLSSEWKHASPPPPGDLFAVARLRPLSRRQMAFSMCLATGPGKSHEPPALASRLESYTGVNGLKRIERYMAMEQRSLPLRRVIDSRRPGFQSSVGEALFMSNNKAAQQLLEPQNGNLTARLFTIRDTRRLVSTAVRTVLSRPVEKKESQRLVKWVEQNPDREQACRQLVWVLITSAEFRFNH